MDKQGLDARQYLPNGYDHTFVEQYGDLFEGSVVRTDFVPFEVPAEDQPKGLADFLTWMEKTGKAPTENTVAGWMNAALFVDGLKAAGPDFDRQKVIDAINEMTDWTGDGIALGVDWTKQHTGSAESTRLLPVLRDDRGQRVRATLGRAGQAVHLRRRCRTRRSSRSPTRADVVEPRISSRRDDLLAVALRPSRSRGRGCRRAGRPAPR